MNGPSVLELRTAARLDKRPKRLKRTPKEVAVPKSSPSAPLEVFYVEVRYLFIHQALDIGLWPVTILEDTQVEPVQPSL